MAKRKSAVRSSSSGKQPVDKLPDESTAITGLALVPGPWICNLPAGDYLKWVALALNTCITRGSLTVVGYLITRKRICLLLEEDWIGAVEGLARFYEILKEALPPESGRPFSLSDERKMRPNGKREVFSIYYRMVAIANPYLPKLLLGQNVRLHYYDPQLARLKENLHGYPYSSIVDYAGGAGPVIVKLIDRRHLPTIKIRQLNEPVNQNT